MKLIKTISKALSWIESSLVVVLFSSMVILAFLQVVLRNVFSSGFLWADPLLRHMVLWIGFIGASLATQKDKHLNLDIITRFVSSKIQNLLRIITNLFATIVTIFIANAGWTFLQNEIESAEIILSIGQFNFPAWWFQIIIPIGFGLMAFRFFIRTIEHLLFV
ncbi:MAG: TRAP transporter small permease, partial [Bacteroidota bacterium]|nr:TRAP transporter small permease [Bacteroidota bacterium]